MTIRETEINKDYFARSRNTINSLSVTRYANDVQVAKKEIERAERDLEFALKYRDEVRDDFWKEFDAIFSRGDTVRYFDGWDMREAEFVYHSDWHVHLKEGDEDFGLSIVINNHYEKVVR